MPQKFFDRKTSVIRAALSVASKTAPTRAEINGAIVLATPGSAATEAIADLNGWTSRNNPISTPDLNSDFDKQEPGTFSADNPTFTFYADLTGTVIRAQLAEGTVLYVMLMWAGDVAGRKMQVWPVRVAGDNDLPSLGNEMHRFETQFAPFDAPAKNVTIPA
ncbi:MAG: hypothetical protein LC798_16810 [Chloroflexi bacterium]|nr:hypothetical protein [Chloroflexota bacterium]